MIFDFKQVRCTFVEREHKGLRLKSISSVEMLFLGNNVLLNTRANVDAKGLSRYPIKVANRLQI